MKLEDMSLDEMGDIVELRLKAELNARMENKTRTQRIVLMYAMLNTLVVCALNIEKYTNNQILQCMFITGIIIETIYLVLLFKDIMRLYEVIEFMSAEPKGYIGDLQVGRTVKVGLNKTIVEAGDEYIEVDTSYRIRKKKIKLGDLILYTIIKNKQGMQMNLFIEGDVNEQKDGQCNND